MTDGGGGAIAAPAESARTVPIAIAWAAWINVVVGAVIMLATLPGRTQGLGLITEPMLRDLQLDRVAYANINLWATLAGSAMCLPIGRLFDRVGLRGATFGLTLLLAAAVWMMSRLPGGATPLFLLVLATRAIGQSALSVASITAVAKSFDRQVGVAMGVYSVLLSVFFAAAFSAVGYSVRVNGWRVAWAQIALGLAVVAAPVILLLRERAIGPRSEPIDEQGGGDGLSLTAALRTPAFWLFGGATSSFGLVSSGLGLFNEAVLAERGFDQPTYVAFLAATALIGLAGQLACGWMTLRWPLPRLLSVAMIVYAVALGTMPLIYTAAQLWIVAVLLGVSGGMITVIFFAVWREAFGPAHLGRIQGAAQMMTVVTSAIGPVVFAECAAIFGSYTPALWILAPCVLLVGVGALRVRLPEVGSVRSLPA